MNEQNHFMMEAIKDAAEMAKKIKWNNQAARLYMKLGDLDGQQSD